MESAKRAVTLEIVGSSDTFDNGGFFAVRTSETEFSGITHVDRVTNGDVTCDKSLHVAGIVFVNTVHEVVMVVCKIEIFDLFVVCAFGVRESVVFIFGDLDVGGFVNANVVLIGAMYLPFLESIMLIFDNFTVFVEFVAVVVHGGFIKCHIAELGFGIAELGSDDFGLGFAAAFDVGATDNDLTHDGGLTEVTEFAGGTTDEAIEFVWRGVATSGSFHVAIEKEGLVALSDVFGTELLGHGFEISSGVSVGKSFDTTAMKDITVFGKSVFEIKFGSGGASGLETGTFSS